MIRPAVESDLPAVSAIYEAILDQEDDTGIRHTGWQRGAYPTADTARNIFDAGTLFVGVDENGTIWGSMNLNGYQLPEYVNGSWAFPAEEAQVAVIHTLTIDPRRTGQGLARQMVDFAENTARAQGKTVLRLDTGVENLPANRMYPRLGYQSAGTVDSFFMGYALRPLNLYEKKL